MESEIAAFEAMDRTNPPPKDALLFIGSSTIRKWATLAGDFPDQRVINRGFGGSKSWIPPTLPTGLFFPMRRG